MELLCFLVANGSKFQSDLRGWSTHGARARAFRLSGKPIVRFNDVCSRGNFSAREQDGRVEGGGSREGKKGRKVCKSGVRDVSNLVE